MDRISLHNFNVRDFSEMLASCKGDVYMITPEGDRLNLKSKLCQIIGFTALIQGGQIAEAKFECSEPEDEATCSATPRAKQPLQTAHLIKGCAVFFCNTAQFQVVKRAA